MSKPSQVPIFTKKEPTRRKPVESKRFRFVEPPQVLEIKHRYLLKPFKTLFNKFPVKIQELKTLCASDKYNPLCDNISTPVDIFQIPPPLTKIAEEHDCKDSIHCNFKTDCPVLTSYDGFIKSNQEMSDLVKLLESYCDFYEKWAYQFKKSLYLLGQPIQEENNLDSEINEAAYALVDEITTKILCKLKKIRQQKMPLSINKKTLDYVLLRKQTSSYL